MQHCSNHAGMGDSLLLAPCHYKVLMQPSPCGRCNCCLTKSCQHGISVSQAGGPLQHGWARLMSLKCSLTLIEQRTTAERPVTAMRYTGNEVPVNQTSCMQHCSKYACTRGSTLAGIYCWYVLSTWLLLATHLMLELLQKCQPIAC